MQNVSLMQNKKVAIFAILGIAAVFTLYYGITGAPKRRTVLPPEEAAVYPGGKNLLPETIVPAKRKAKKTQFRVWGRNPFLPADTPSAPDLSGILWDAQAPKAIISGNIVAVGDKVGGNTVVEIKQDRVILSDGAAYIELKLE